MLGKNRPGQVLADFVLDKVDDIKKVDINIFQDGFVQDSYGKALLNTVKLWLLSGRYDRIRQPDWAGFFDKRLREYQMSEEGARKVEQDLGKAIAGKIKDVNITEIKATPKLGERAWEVGVEAIDSSTDISTSGNTSGSRGFISILDDDTVTNIKSMQRDENGNMVVVDEEINV